MEKPQLEMCCPICEKSVTLRQEFYVNEHGKLVHAHCYVERISQDKNRFSGPAA